MKRKPTLVKTKCLVVHCARKEKDRVINYAFLAISKNSGSHFLKKINSPGKKLICA
jgi:hypothetical protein